MLCYMECEQQVMQTWGANSVMLVSKYVLIVEMVYVPKYKTMSTAFVLSVYEHCYK